MERDLLEKGMTRAAATAQAELVVLNTCTVTTSADHDARATIRRIHRENPGARIIVTGCYAQRAPGELASLPGVSLVVGNSHKSQLAEIDREIARLKLLSMGIHIDKLTKEQVKYLASYEMGT